jgi:site-specific DNA-methyltransferase (adenine-specific)
MAKQGNTSRKLEAVGSGHFYKGDCRAWLRAQPDASIDAIVTDPPYEINFSNKAWDRSGIAYDTEMWAEVLRVVKPGGYVIVAAATRTYHRVAVALEDAGFDLRDTIHWTYGSGFAKSRTLAPGVGTALKPSHEILALARRPSDGTLTEAFARWGTGLRIDDCRIGEGTGELVTKKYPDMRGGKYLAGEDRATIERTVLDQGRMPANTLLTHSAECVQVGVKNIRSSGAAPKRSAGTQPHHVLAGGWKPIEREERQQRGLEGRETVPKFDCAADCAVAALAAQHEAAELFFHQTEWTELDYDQLRYVAKPKRKEKRAGVKETTERHVTVKPVELMRYLVRLVTPPDGVVADPFLGSGTTAVAAELERRHWVGCELTREYWPLIRQRVRHVVETGSATAA